MPLFRFAMLLLVCAMSIPSGASSIEDAQKITVEVQDAFAHERFSDITAMADRYRVQKSRSGDGLWNLTLFYSGIYQVIHSETDDREIAPAYAAIEQKLQRWAALQPRSPAAHLAYAAALLEHAWAIRGGCYASCVKPEAWAPFHALVEKSRRYLEQHKAVAAVDPHWYELMLHIARLQSWDAKKFGTLFDAAIAREPLFYQTWFEAVDYFLPKWRGSAKDVEMFAQLAADKTAATEGTGMYARIYWYASQSQFGDEIFQDSLANWPAMKTGFDDILARYPDAWNENNYGKFACLARDKKATQAFFATIRNRLMGQAWSFGQLAACQAWAKSGAI